MKSATHEFKPISEVQDHLCGVKINDEYCAYPASADIHMPTEQVPAHKFVWGAASGGCDRTVNGKACGLPEHSAIHQVTAVQVAQRLRTDAEWLQGRDERRKAAGVDKATPRPWVISGATVIWSPSSKSNVAAVSDPRPSHNSSVGYFEIRPWGDSEDAPQRFEEACANAELIVRSVNNSVAFDAVVKALRAIQTEAEFVGDAKAPFSTWVAGRARAALQLVRNNP